VSADRANNPYDDFCKEVEEKHPSNTINRSFVKKYNEGTPEEHEFVVTLGNGVSSFDKDECVKSMEKLIN
jgi:hypothetical protein